jgi:Anti-sigma factor NepR
MKERKPPEDAGSDESMDSRPNSMKKGKKGKGQAALGRDIQSKIGQQLRSYYDTLIEPTPDRFADLLRQLEKPGKDGAE